MKTEKAEIQTLDAFDAESKLLSLDAVVSVHIVTATQLRIKYKPNESTVEAIAASIGGTLITN